MAVDKTSLSARARGAAAPRARRVYFDKAADSIVIVAKSGTTVIIPRRLLKGPLRTAHADELQRVELLADGTMPYWPDVDDGLDLADLLGRALDLKSITSVASKAGSARSAAKAAAARANGAKGGRPRKGREPTKAR